MMCGRNDMDILTDTALSERNFSVPSVMEDLHRDRPDGMTVGFDLEIISRQGFDTFTRHSFPRLIRYYLSRRLDMEDAQDLAQEALLLHWRKRHASMPPHWAFLLGIARRLFFVFLRTRWPNSLSLEELPSMDVPDPFPSASAATDEAPLNSLPSVIELLARSSGLTPCQRRVLQLRYMEGLSVRQAAATLGITPSALQIHERRAVAELRRSNEKNFYMKSLMESCLNKHQGR